MTVQKAVILGAGRLGRVVLDTFEATNEVEPTFDVLGFIVDPEYGTPGTVINDRPILGGFDWLAEHKQEVQAICAVGEPRFRLRLVQRARRAGVRFCSLVYPGAIVSPRSLVGQGTVVTQGCILCNQARIGDHVIVGLGSIVAEDVVIGDYTFLAAGVCVAGGCTIEEGSYIGTGANIIDGRCIGAWAIVGAGATIIKDVPENTTVVGVPGRIIETRPDGWHLE